MQPRSVENCVLEIRPSQQNYEEDEEVFELRWSKTKALVENRLNEKLKKRIGIHAARYNVNMGEQRRIWITLDGEEILDASSAHFLMEHDKLWGEVKKKTNKPYLECLYEYYPEFVGQVHDMNYSMLILEQRGILNVDRVYDALVEYPNLGIESALHSENNITRALAMFDKRVGKRRLQRLVVDSNSHPLVMEFYRIRSVAEGLPAPASPIT